MPPSTPPIEGPPPTPPPRPPPRHLEKKNKQPMKRPCAVAVDRGAGDGTFGVMCPDDLCEHPHNRWGRIVLVAEAGAMCVSVFRIAVGRSCIMSEHVCDICVGQLGTGMHAPHLGKYSWLSIDVTKEGDIVVADCDKNCLYEA